jgi:hypothetical protein
MEGDAQARRRQHRQVVGAVAHRHGVGGRKPVLVGQALQGGKLGLLAQDRQIHRAGERPAVMLQAVGSVRIEA